MPKEIEQFKVHSSEVANSLTDEAKLHFLKVVEEGNPPYPYLPRHTAECERWAKKLLENHSEADEEVVLLSVWLHDIGWAFGDRDDDHAVKSEIETRQFLSKRKIAPKKIEKVAHSVRAHRCGDVRPETLEAKILVAADSASHMTDINYIVHASDGIKDYAIGKLERDYRDVGLFPELQKEITPLYEAWKQLLSVYPG